VPLGGQHYLLHGHSLPLAILVVTGLSSIRLPAVRISVIVVTVFFSSLSNVGTYIKDIKQMADPEFGGYIEPELTQLVHEIGRRCGSDDVLLASPSIGGPVILEYVCRLWMLEDEQTVAFHERQRELRALAAGDSQVAKRLLAQADIVALAKRQAYGDDIAYSAKAGLVLNEQGWRPVFDNETGTIFIRKNN